MIVDMNDALLDANPDAFLYGKLLMGRGKKGVSLSARTLLLVYFVVLVFPIFLADVVKRCLPRCVLCGRVICRSVSLSRSLDNLAYPNFSFIPTFGGSYHKRLVS